MWRNVKLKDICTVFDDGNWIETKDQSEEGIRLIQTGNVKLGAFAERKNKARYISEKTFKRLNCKEIFAGDILVSRLPDPAGRACIIPKLSERAITAVDCTIIRLNESCLPEYLNYVMQSSQYFADIQNKVTGATRQRISRKNLGEVSIPLPPQAEQQRIVTKLDAAFAEVDKTLENANNNHKNIQNILKLYFNSVQNRNINNLCKKNIGELCNLMTGGTPDTKNKSYFRGGKIPWLVSGDINKNVINDCEGRITELGYKNSNAKYLPINSVMIALNGQGKTRGSVAMLKIKATCNQSLVSIYPKDEKKISTDLIYYILKFKYEEIRKLTGDSGNDRRGLNMSLVRGIELFYPENYQEQLKLVRKIEIFSKNILKLKEIYQNKINSLFGLKQSILQQSFNGNYTKAA